MNQAIDCNSITTSERIVGNFITTQIGNGGDSVWSDNATVLLLAKAPDAGEREIFIGLVKFPEGIQVLTAVIPNTEARQANGDMYVSGGAIWMEQVPRYMYALEREVTMTAIEHYKELIEFLPLSVRMTK